MNESGNNRNIVCISSVVSSRDCSLTFEQMFGVAALIGLTTAAYWVGYRGEGSGGRLKEKGEDLWHITLFSYESMLLLKRKKLGNNH